MVDFYISICLFMFNIDSRDKIRKELFHIDKADNITIKKLDANAKIIKKYTKIKIFY